MVGWGWRGWGAVAWLWAAASPAAAEPLVRFASAPAAEPRSHESTLLGDASWRKGRPASPGELQVFSSTQSALAGERISVEISAREASVVHAEVFRLGVYGGTGAAKVWSSGPLEMSTQPRCARASCPARKSFSLEVARDWEPGLYLVKVKRADGLRSFTSLVVKDGRAEEPRS